MNYLIPALTLDTFCVFGQSEQEVRDQIVSKLEFGWNWTGMIQRNQIGKNIFYTACLVSLVATCVSNSPRVILTKKEVL